MAKEGRECLGALQGLLGSAGGGNDGKRQKAVAQQVGVRERRERRELWQLRQEGASVVIRRSRLDRGAAGISLDWQKVDNTCCFLPDWA